MANPDDFGSGQGGQTGWPDAAADPAENRVIDAFRRWGYLEASLDPLELALPRPHPELPTEGETAARARGWYCGPIGVEFMHIPDPARRRWVRERMERPTPPIDAAAVLERLVKGGFGFLRRGEDGFLGHQRFRASSTRSGVMSSRQRNVFGGANGHSRLKQGLQSRPSQRFFAWGDRGGV